MKNGALLQVTLPVYKVVKNNPTLTNYNSTMLLIKASIGLSGTSLVMINS